MFKNLLIILTTAAAILEISNACHIYRHGGRHKRSVAREIKQFFADCLKTFSPSLGDYVSTVKLIVDSSEWFKSTADKTCSPSDGLDTVQCWSNAVRELFFDDAPMLNSSLESVTNFAEHEAAKANYHTEHSSDPRCPPRSEARFVECVNNILRKYNVEETFEDDFLSLSTILLSEENIKCRNCQCDQILEQSPEFKEHMLNNGLSCQSCWPLRIAALIRNDSVLAHPVRACALTMDDVVIPEHNL